MPPPAPTGAPRQFDGDFGKKARGKPENPDFGQNLRRIGWGESGQGPGPVDLLVLAGGRGRRLDGAAKPAVVVAGRTLLSRVLDARGLARRVVVVGPDEARAAAGTAAPGVTWTLEDPPFGGPVAGIAAGLAALAERDAAATGAEAVGAGPAEWLLLLACDLPWAADAARTLVAAVADPALPAGVSGLHLSDDGGRAQWLAGIYRAADLRAAARRLGPAATGASMRDLLAGFTLRALRDDAGAGRDVDTWQDVEETAALLDPPESADPNPAGSNPLTRTHPDPHPPRSDTA